MEELTWAYTGFFTPFPEGHLDFERRRWTLGLEWQPGWVSPGSENLGFCHFQVVQGLLMAKGVELNALGAEPAAGAAPRGFSGERRDVREKGSEGTEKWARRTGFLKALETWVKFNLTSCQSLSWCHYFYADYLMFLALPHPLSLSFLPPSLLILVSPPF